MARKVEGFLSILVFKLHRQGGHTLHSCLLSPLTESTGLRGRSLPAPRQEDPDVLVAALAS
jgi:hypothetical protein